MKFEARLLPCEREVLLAGSKLKYLSERSEETAKGASARPGSGDQT